MVFHSWPFISALSRSYLTQSFQHSFGLPLLLLPPSSAFHAPFDSLASPIFSVCPAHLICFRLFSSLGVFSCQFLLSILSSSFSLLWLLCIVFGPSYFLLSVFSPPVSMSVSVFPTNIYRLVPHMFPTLFLLVVSSVSCPT